MTLEDFFLAQPRARLERAAVDQREADALDAEYAQQFEAAALAGQAQGQRSAFWPAPVHGLPPVAAPDSDRVPHRAPARENSFDIYSVEESAKFAAQMQELEPELYFRFKRGDDAAWDELVERDRRRMAKLAADGGLKFDAADERENERYYYWARRRGLVPKPTFADHAEALGRGALNWFKGGGKFLWRTAKAPFSDEDAKTLAATGVEAAQSMVSGYKQLGAGTAAWWNSDERQQMYYDYEVMKFAQDEKAREGEWRRKVGGEAFAAIKVDEDEVNFASGLIDLDNFLPNLKLAKLGSRAMLGVQRVGQLARQRTQAAIRRAELEGLVDAARHADDALPLPDAAVKPSGWTNVLKNADDAAPRPAPQATPPGWTNVLPGAKGATADAGQAGARRARELLEAQHAEAALQRELTAARQAVVDELGDAAPSAARRALTSAGELAQTAAAGAPRAALEGYLSGGGDTVAAMEGVGSTIGGNVTHSAYRAGKNALGKALDGEATAEAATSAEATTKALTTHETRAREMATNAPTAHEAPASASALAPASAPALAPVGGASRAATPAARALRVAPDANASAASEAAAAEATAKETTARETRASETPAQGTRATEAPERSGDPARPAAPAEAGAGHSRAVAEALIAGTETQRGADDLAETWRRLGAARAERAGEATREAASQRAPRPDDAAAREHATPQRAASDREVGLQRSEVETPEGRRTIYRGRTLPERLLGRLVKQGRLAPDRAEALRTLSDAAREMRDGAEITHRSADDAAPAQARHEGDTPSAAARRTGDAPDPAAARREGRWGRREAVVGFEAERGRGVTVHTVDAAALHDHAVQAAAAMDARQAYAKHGEDIPAAIVADAKRFLANAAEGRPGTEGLDTARGEFIADLFGVAPGATVELGALPARARLPRGTLHARPLEQMTEVTRPAQAAEERADRAGGEAALERGRGSVSRPVDEPSAAPAEAPVRAPIVPRESPVSAAIHAKLESAALAQEVREALTEIDRVHDDGSLPDTSLDARPLPNSRGTYFPAENRIAVSEHGLWRKFTTLHEVGHLLDCMALGERGRYASESHPALEKWRRAVDTSRVVQKFRETLTTGKPVRNADYYLSRVELWARSYAQYVAMRSGDPELRRQLRDAKIQNKYTQWSYKDFEPIAAAIDELLAAKGWRKL